MYIDSIKIENFRTFGVQEKPITFVHPEQNFAELGFARSPRIKNINLLPGNNGSGKTSVLRAVALACLGPAVSDSGIFPYRLIRREPRVGKPTGNATPPEIADARIEAFFSPHGQDEVSGSSKLKSTVGVLSQGDIEKLRWLGSDVDAKHWGSDL